MAPCGRPWRYGLALRLGRGFHASKLRCQGQLADLLSHLLADLGGEAIVKTGIDTRIGNFVAIVLKPGPLARDPRSGRAGQRKFAEFIADNALKNGSDRS